MNLQLHVLQTPLQHILGIGTAKINTLMKELQIATIGQLLQHYPYRYLDRTRFYAINQLHEQLPAVQLKGTIANLQTVGTDNKKRLVATFKDESGQQMELLWFAGIQWVEKQIPLLVPVVIFGKPSMFRNSFSISHPEIQTLTQFLAEGETGLQPLYNSTEAMKRKGMDGRGFAKLIQPALNWIAQFDLENLPNDLRQQNQLIGRLAAWQQIHMPKSELELQQAIRRFKFEELFFVQFGLVLNKQYQSRTTKGFIFDQIGTFFNQFYKDFLPFELTGAQKRVLKEIRADTKSGKQMNRLVQGDVGSGKTMVALLSMLMAKDNGFQAALMAPTEILAQQHFGSITEMLKGMAIKVALLTGSTKTALRKQILQATAEGHIDILIGTHALIEPVVVFKNLGLAVIDEQHRFGVEQRANLWKKNNNPPHVLVMTATPIPRTLAMTIYGDLDISIIDELPAGRKPIQTFMANDSARLRLFGFLKEQIALGRQIYVVYPMIEESEKADLKFLMDGFESLSRAFPLPQYQISIVHGKMKPADKAFEMDRFVKGQTQIMVATTVIEVGVNVPNATVMVIESAERFGLSQLHQLRGRVGRGAEQSYCVLMAGFKLSAEGKKRLQTMVKTNDGFEIAAVDMELRGPGDLAGTQQSGVLDFKLANLVTDGPLLNQIRQQVLDLFQNDPNFTHQNMQLLYYCHAFQTNSNTQIDWSNIS